MARSSLVLALTTAATGAAALAHTALAVSTAGATIPAHGRSGLYVVGIAGVTLVWAAAIVLTRSVAIALAGGVLAGGAAGNVVSLALWPSVPGVPNPLLAGDFAFNVADLAVAAGAVLLLASAAMFGVRNRERLHEPVRLRT